MLGTSLVHISIVSGCGGCVSGTSVVASTSVGCVSGAVDSGGDSGGLCDLDEERRLK